MNLKSDIGNYELVIKVTEKGCRSLKVMEKIKCIADGENADVGAFKVGDIKSVSEAVSKVLCDRDGVAERIKTQKIKKEIKDGGE